MVKMSTIEFISNQNLTLSSAAKNYEMKTEDPRFCYPQKFYSEHKSGFFQVHFIHQLKLWLHSITYIQCIHTYTHIYLYSYISKYIYIYKYIYIKINK